MVNLLPCIAMDDFERITNLQRPSLTFLRESLTILISLRENRMFLRECLKCSIIPLARTNSSIIDSMSFSEVVAWA
jgi:hypothetical protein